MKKLFVMAALPSVLALSLSIAGVPHAAAGEDASQKAPRFELAPAWLKPLPNNYTMGEVRGLDVDSKDHVWVLAYPNSLDPDSKRFQSTANLVGQTSNPPTSKCCRHSPEVIELDSAGNYVQGWGGKYSPADLSQAHCEWPESSHGLTVDHKDNVWICGIGATDHQCLKLTKAGRCLLQIGRAGQSKGSLDTENVNRAAQVAVLPKTNEVFIADGYGNRRVIVFDADSGKFKRMWGAYGNKPDDSASKDRLFEGPTPQQFNLVHGISISNDGLVYVSDRMNNRVQVFTTEGKFLKEVFINRKTLGPTGTALTTAFSADQKQKDLYVGDLSNFAVLVFDRQTQQEIPEAGFGRGGFYPGQFIQLHFIETDSKGDVYAGDAATGVLQKWLRK